MATARTAHLQSPNPGVRREAVRLLGTAGNAKAIPVLVALCTTDDAPEVRQCAATALQAIGGSTPEDLLTECLNRHLDSDRLKASVGEATWEEWLAAAAAHPERRSRAAVALVRLGNPSGIRILLQHLTRPARVKGAAKALLEVLADAPNMLRQVDLEAVKAIPDEVEGLDHVLLKCTYYLKTPAVNELARRKAAKLAKEAAREAARATARTTAEATAAAIPGAIADLSDPDQAQASFAFLLAVLRDSPALFSDSELRLLADLGPLQKRERSHEEVRNFHDHTLEGHEWVERLKSLDVAELKRLAAVEQSGRQAAASNRIACAAEFHNFVQKVLSEAPLVLRKFAERELELALSPLHEPVSYIQIMLQRAPEALQKADLAELCSSRSVSLLTSIRSHYTPKAPPVTLETLQARQVVEILAEAIRLASDELERRKTPHARAEEPAAEPVEADPKGIADLLRHLAEPSAAPRAFSLLLGTLNDSPSLVRTAELNAILELDAMLWGTRPSRVHLLPLKTAAQNELDRRKLAREGSSAKETKPPSETVRLNCPCGAVYVVRAELAGQKTRCPRCRELLVVPGSGS